MSTKMIQRKNFTEGPLFFRITLFALPIMLTGILQICYGMADNIVVGKFSGDPNALAAVGSTTSLTNLIINLLLGIAGGTGVVVAQCFGAREDRNVSRAVHTALAFSVMGGVFISVLGLIISKPVLELMDTKIEILDSATLYLRIICIGIPANSLYNFGASVLRSTGDSKSPLIILSSSGIINVILNLVFVIGCKMTVDGVAFATIISQYISAVTVVFVLSRKRGESFCFSFDKLCFDKRLFKRILRYGIPAGIQGSMFSIGNVLMTSAVNTFPTSTVTANTIASNIDALTYTSMNSFAQASMTFVGQNYGAVKKERIKKSIIYCIIQVAVIGNLVAYTELIFGKSIINLFVDSASPDKEVIIETTYSIMKLLLTTYILCGFMDVFSAAVRGLGCALSPMLVSISCICGIRIFWIYVIFPMESMNTITGLYTAYPASWGAALIGMIIILIFTLRKLDRNEEKNQKNVNVSQKNEQIVENNEENVANIKGS